VRGELRAQIVETEAYRGRTTLALTPSQNEDEEHGDVRRSGPGLHLLQTTECIGCSTSWLTVQVMVRRCSSGLRCRLAGIEEMRVGDRGPLRDIDLSLGLGS